MAFVALAAQSSSFHPTWISLVKPSLAGVRLPSPVSVAMLQSYLVLQSTEWVHMMLAPFFSRLVAGKMKRKRAMKDSDLTESFNIAVELLTSEEALAALPRNVRALGGLLWIASRDLGINRNQQIEIVADFYFQRLVYPVLLVPDQFGLVDEDRPLKPLAKQILMGVSKCLSACIYQMDLGPTVYSCMVPYAKEAWAKISRFCEFLVVDPEGKGWWDFVNLPESINVGTEYGDAGLGLWLSLIVDVPGSLANDAEFVSLVDECRIVGSELERRRAIANIINEEQEFTLRVDGVTFWLRELDYGVMMEGTAMRMANEWLKKVNQLRAVLRIGLNKRLHVSQWNGVISDLIETQDWTVFSEFAKILRSNLAIVANSVDESLEQAIKSYKEETSRDPLRDLVALLVHGRSLLTRIGRLPAALDPLEQSRLMAALDKANSSMNEAIASDCSEMVRLHQMQTSIVAGWSNFPPELLEQSGMVKPGRRQVQYGKIVALSPPAIKSAKYAMLLSDALVLLDLMPAKTAPEDKSSARDREANFGGGNAFQQKRIAGESKAVKKVPKQEASETVRDTSKEIFFRLVKCINLTGAQLRLKPSSHSFVLIDKSGASHELSFLPAQKMDWVTAWAKIEGMEHSQSSSSKTPRAAGGVLQVGEDSPRSPNRTPRSGSATPRSDSASSPRTESVPAPETEDEDYDEMEALMALGMYDTAVIVKADVVANDADNAFASMVGQIKRRDGKQRIALADLFTPPPGLIVKEWQKSIRMMRSVEEPAEENEGIMSPLSPRSPRSSGTVEITFEEEDAESKQRADSEEAQLRAMMANFKVPC